MSELQQRIFTVTQSDAGVRLDKFLSTQMPDFSRSEIQRFDVVRTPAGPVKMSERVRVGDVYRVDIPAPVTTDATAAGAPDFDLDILYEDDDIIVINKPRGVVMYPSAGNHSGTLVQNILAHTHLSALGGATRPGVVHRLDKDTSGVMVFAKSDAAYRELVKTFAAHDLTRKYVTFVWGLPNWESADITGNIARSSRNRQKMTMVKTGGKPAHTEVTVADTWSRSRVSLLRCRLLTGRTHQIRVHLSVHGFPVLCDPVYGRGATRLGSVRNPELLEFLREHNGQMLHAEVLEFNHPTTGVPMHFKSRMPDDMQELKAILDDAQYA
ncbi:MAG: RluA family pseudouridine synthase [Alphaproteobacteria bacterium]|nr:RluA family pseudouridine synthase [Alphaproteobacteria bacterium]MDE6571222.1 RluA family pseudouridine synthase [Alphaproteobacteria bacterium]